MNRTRSRFSRFLVCLAWLLGLACLLTIVRAAPLPATPLPYYIRDDAKWLSPSEFQSLNEKLKAYERETSSQIVVGIFPELPAGEELFDFTQRLFDAWKPGLKGKDNGVLFVIFANERKMRIHTGYGMEGVLPDARSNQIIRNVIAPRLRQGNRYAAIDGGVDAMIAAAKGEYTGTGSTHLESSQGSSGPGWVFYLVIAFFVVGFFFPKLFSIADVIFTPGGPRTRSGGGWTSGPTVGGWGGGSSGGGWGGSSGGGGFSGGGGSSGGGGASGDW